MGESAREMADRAKDLADAAAENLGQTRPDDEDLAGADVDVDGADHSEQLRPDGRGEDLTGPGAPMP